MRVMHMPSFLLGAVHRGFACGTAGLHAHSLPPAVAGSALSAAGLPFGPVASGKPWCPEP